MAWDPVAAKLGGASRAWIVPEGPLHLVDFAALPTRGGSWLVDQPLLLCRVGAERDLESPDAAAQGRGELLAVGGPDFEAQPDSSSPVSGYRGSPLACEQFRDVRFGALPGAAREVEDVARLWRAGGGEFRVLSGSAARKSDFESLAAKATTLHLATHGFFLGSGCVAGRSGSRGVGGLAPSGSRIARPSDRSAETPLRLAGLAFAGANHRDQAQPGGDDGILTGEEIASLDLTAVQDVVLSACDSGVGDVATGEGVLGLQRAFRIAGAHSLVMSLWPVEDRATRLWMSSWYRARLQKGASAAAATRDASRACLAALRAAGRPTPPSSWAGFVASGPGR
jgi:CHAT domain-containing protein